LALSSSITIVLILYYTIKYNYYFFLFKPVNTYILRFFAFLVLFLIFTNGFSQKTNTKDFELVWDDYTTLNTFKGKSIKIPLVHNNMIDENNLPVYSTTFNAEKNAILHNYRLTNVKFEELSGNTAINLQKNLIPEKLNASFNISFNKDNAKGVLRMTPLIKNGNQIKKVTSFTLVYETGQKQELLQKKGVRAPVFANNSVLATGTWYKFSVDTTGVFKINKDFLQKIGINTGNLDPKKIRIYGNGGNLLPQLNSEFRYDDLQENSIYVQGEEDGKFDNSDFILFYAKGPEAWKTNPSDISLSRHINNIYSDVAYYFINVDLGNGKRISASDEISGSADNEISTFQDFLVHEIDETNLFANGQQWMGENLSFDNTKSFRFSFKGLVTGEDLFVRVRGVAVSSTSSSMDVGVNGSNLMQLNFQGISGGSLNLASPAERIQSTRSDQENLEIRITYQNNGNPSAKAYLDYIEIFGTKKLAATGKQFAFRNLSANNPSGVYRYKIQNSNNIYQVWDVSDYLHPRIVKNISDQNDFIFRSYGSETPKEFVLINEEDLYTPDVPDDIKIVNQDLHALKDVEYLIITRDYLMTEAQRLADYHQNNSNLNTKVVDIQQIYNEFSSGSPDLTAIRDFVRFLYLNDSSAEKRIKYLLLFGDTSFDFKDRITDNNNIVPAFQSYESFNLARGYVTDDYFGMMDEDEGDLSYDDQIDVATGRFPVTTTMEAKVAVDKTLSYYNSSSFGDWRNIITVIADDPDKPNEFILQKTVDLLAENIKTNKPGFNIKKIYCDAYKQETSAGGERYPDVNTAIDNAMESGTLIINYFGHGGINGWANERILEVPQIQNWKNKDKLPLFITVTCEFSRFDNPLSPTAGEFTFSNPNGGSINMITTSREIYISVGQTFNKTLMEYLLEFSGEKLSISEALIQTKNRYTTNQRFFVYFFGDPAMNLAQPKPDIRITKMNGIDITQKRDTLKALKKITFEGIVTDASNNIIDDFNGEISTVIYDKALDKTTLDNDNFGKTMDFTSIESKIYRGRASVNNGKFTLEFIVPKDIRIAYGKSKISFYADDKNVDRSGYDFDITIGGIDSDAPEDNTGPEIRLYLNDESFVDGGNTNVSPVLLAVLQDDSGINTSITAVDHDIIAVIDNNDANPIVLNDYYQTEVDDFKQGKVKYQLRDLEPGTHTLKFKCWDTYNNLSESSLSFIVVDNSDVILSNVLNYPNPFINHTEFWFNHNKPNETLKVNLQIFTISGKLVKTINQTVQSTGTLSREITWNGLDDFGNKIGKGVYIYKLRVQSVNSNKTAEKTEKLVILQ
jgi:hypothetical protein